jgi:hypothetical protein
MKYVSFYMIKVSKPTATASQDSIGNEDKVN